MQVLMVEVMDTAAAALSETQTRTRTRTQDRTRTHGARDITRARVATGVQAAVQVAKALAVIGVGAACHLMRVTWMRGSVCALGANTATPTTTMIERFACDCDGDETVTADCHAKRCWVGVAAVVVVWIVLTMTGAGTCVSWQRSLHS